MENPHTSYKQAWLPTSKEEIKRLGWDHIDVILFSGDAYIDHPSMGCAVIGRVLEAHGYNVAIIPQPNWQDDLRDFRKIRRSPIVFFGVSAGAMDSMVNHYTAARRRRSDDAYTPNGRHGARPDYPTIIYSRILKQLYPDIPIIAGGIEASLRRLSHYDYWSDSLKPSILLDSAADMIVYGMGERPILEICDRLSSGETFENIDDIKQTAILKDAGEMPKINDEAELVLHSFEECLRNKRSQAENFKLIEIESNKWHGRVIWQQHGQKAVKVNPMFPPMTEKRNRRVFRFAVHPIAASSL